MGLGFWKFSQIRNNNRFKRRLRRRMEQAPSLQCRVRQAAICPIGMRLTGRKRKNMLTCRNFSVIILRYDCYSQLLCVAAADSAVEHMNPNLKEVQPAEAYLSAQQASPFQGARLPPENGYFQRPQGSCPPPCQGPQGSVRLMSRLRPGVRMLL